MAPDVGVKRCCVRDCPTQRNDKKDVKKIPMHMLPPASDAGDDDSKKARGAQRARWLLLSGREEKDITAENQYICATHFQPNAYHQDKDNRKLKKLNENAVPSLFLPPLKENVPGKKMASSFSTESDENCVGSSTASPNSESEMNCEQILPTEADDISPVQASHDLDASSSKDSMETELFDCAAKPNDDTSEPLAANVPVGGEKLPSEVVNGISDSKEPITVRLSLAKITAKTKPTQSKQSDIVNGSAVEVTKSNGSAVTAGSAPKRRFCEDSDGETASGSQRKKLTQDPKPQARVKTCPRRSDLPDIVAGAANKRAYLKGFTETLLAEALRHLQGAFEKQTTQMTRILEQLKADSEDIEKQYKELTCRLNACKRPESRRNVAIQMSSLASSLPTMTAEVMASQQASSFLTLPTTTSRATPMAMDTTTSTSTITTTVTATTTRTRANPVAVAVTQPMPVYHPRNSQLTNQSQNVRTAATSEPVIDLTDDEPEVSVVRAPNAALNIQKFSSPSTTMPMTTTTTTTTTRGPSPSAIRVSHPSTSPLRTVLLPERQFLARPGAQHFAGSPVAFSSATQGRPMQNVVSERFPLPPGTVIEPVSKNAVLPSGDPRKVRAEVPNQWQQQYQQQQQQQQHQQQQQQHQQQQPQPQQQLQQQRLKSRTTISRPRHPAPLPGAPLYKPNELHTPPAPRVDVKVGGNGIILILDMRMENNLKYSPVVKFEVFIYTENDRPPSTDLWHCVNTINAEPMPMEVTFKAYKQGYRYFFAVRGVDQLNRLGAFNDPVPLDLRESYVV